MKIVLQISLVLFVAVTFGAAQDDEVEGAIDNCYDMSYFGEDVCYDYDKVIACVEKIRPRNDNDREELQGVIAEEKAMKNACPGLKSTKLCIDSELQRCRSKLDELISNNTKEVCNEVKVTKDCLVRFNNSCNGDVIGREVEEMENIKEMCAQGYYNDGPCHPIHVEECTDKVYDGAFDGGDDDENLEFLNCKAADVAAAKMCLSQLKAKCTSKFVQEDIDIELQTLDEECSPSNDGRRQVPSKRARMDVT